MTDWVARETERYNQAWATHKYVPSFGPRVIDWLFKKFDFSKVKRMLDVGCGLGSAVKYCRDRGIEAYGIDIAKEARPYWIVNGIEDYCKVASASSIPYPDEYFDFVLCTEVLEHIPEEGIGKVLEEIYRVGSGDFFMTIATTPAMERMPHDGSEPHLCIKPVWWWEQMFYWARFATNLSFEEIDLKDGTPKNGYMIWAGKSENQH